jgi:hypothetical protein
LDAWFLILWELGGKIGFGILETIKYTFGSLVDK